MVTGRIRTLIADDEPAARDAIALLLGGDPDIEVIGVCPDGATTLDAIRDQAPDLVFLDVQMPQLDGFSVLRQLEPEQMPIVVFVTAYDQYALRAFDIHALDYLLKPFDDERFHLAVSRAKDRARQGRLGALSRRLLDTLTATSAAAAGEVQGGGPRKRLLIKKDGRTTVLGVHHIDWIEADGDNLRIHAGKATHTLRETMTRLETLLDPEVFVRVHRSTIVNVERIQFLEPYFRGEYVLMLADGTRLKLARRCKERLAAVLGREF